MNLLTRVVGASTLLYCVMFGLLCWGVAAEFGVDTARAQSIATTRPPMASTPQTVNGFVTMTSGLMVDGGITTPYVKSGREDVQELYVDGGTRLNTLEVSGSASFRERPSGLVLQGSLPRATALTVGVGCSTLGTSSLPGALAGDACVVSQLPSAALSLGLTFDCYVTAANTVTVRSCGLVSLVAAPAGTYLLRVIGP